MPGLPGLLMSWNPQGLSDRVKGANPEMFWSEMPKNTLPKVQEELQKVNL